MIKTSDEGSNDVIERLRAVACVLAQLKYKEVDEIAI